MFISKLYLAAKSIFVAIYFYYTGKNLIKIITLHGEMCYSFMISRYAFNVLFKALTLFCRNDLTALFLIYLKAIFFYIVFVLFDFGFDYCRFHFLWFLFFFVLWLLIGVFTNWPNCFV